MELIHIVLPLTAFATSALTGIVGMGGGLMLILVMAEFLAFSVLIPVHGINQLITHFSRASISYKQINWKISVQFGLGAVVGAITGSQFVLSVPEQVFKILLGLFVLISLFLPSLKEIKPVPGKWSLVGAFTSFWGLFVGATGVLIAPFFIREQLDKESLVSTKAACQVFIHGTKVIAYFLLGFTLGPYILLIVLMGTMSFLGSLLAKHLLSKIHERHFYLLFRVMIIILAARLIILGIYEFV